MSLFNFPNQRIPESEKDENWDRSHILNYIAYTGTDDYTMRKSEINKLYFAAAGKMTKSQRIACEKTITQRYGKDFGPQYFVYPLIKNRIEQLVSDYRQRPLKRKCLVNNEKAVIKKLDAKVDMVTEGMIREINSALSEDLGFVPETEKPQMEIPKDVEEFFEKDYRTLSEEVSEDVLYQLLLVKKEKERIYEALKHYLIGGRIHGYMNEKDGHPSVFIPHPLSTFYDIDVTTSVQKDIQYFVWDEYMSINEIFNTFDLTKTQKDIIEAYAGIGPKSTNTVSTNNINWFQVDGQNLRPRVVSMEWISRKTVKVMVHTTKDGVEEFKILPEDFKQRNNREYDIRSIEIDDVRHIIMCGPEVVLSHGSLEDQMKTIGNPKKRFLNAVGLVDESAIGVGNVKSVANSLYYLQDFASEILYELRLSLRQLDGNVLAYDLSGIPKEWMRLGIDKAMEQVHYSLKRDRVMFYNSKDKRSNGFANSANVSQKGRTGELIQMLGVIEDMADRITGQSPGSRGQSNPYTKATTAEIDLTASTTRAEEYYGIFDTWVETLLERMILKAKQVYKKNDVFNYFGGDHQAKFLKVFPDFFLEDIGVYIGDNRKEYERKQRIDKMAETSFGASGDPDIMYNLIRIWNTDNATDAEAIWSNGLKQLEKLKQENMKAAQEVQAQQDQLKRDELQQKDDQHTDQMQNNIDVAYIYANNKADDTREKEAGLDRRKAADIDKDLLLKDKDSGGNK